MKRLLALFDAGLLALAPCAAFGQKSSSKVNRTRAALVSADGAAASDVEGLRAACGELTGEA